MSFTIQDMMLTAETRYEMKFLAGKNGWSNSISWVHLLEDTTIIQNFWGKELAVTTGLGFPEKEDWMHLAQQLNRYHASGLVINVGQYIYEVPEELKAYCDENDLPLLTVPWEVHLSDMIKDFSIHVFLKDTTDEQIASALIAAIETPDNQDAYRKDLLQYFDVDGSFQVLLIKGTPLLLNETLWAAGMAILTQCYSIRGLNVVAAQNIANTINNVFNVVFIALGDSVAIVVGQLLGAGNMKKARDTDNKMIAFSVMCCTGVALVMLIVAPFFPKLYNTNLDAQELAKYFIMIMAIFMPQNAFLHASYFTLRSGGKTIITFLFDSVFVWCVSVPIAYCLSRFTGLHVLAVFAMVQVGDILKCIVGFVLVKKGVWMQNIVSGK